MPPALGRAACSPAAPVPRWQRANADRWREGVSFPLGDASNDLSPFANLETFSVVRMLFAD
jgi:hypothetical protein